MTKNPILTSILAIAITALFTACADDEAKTDPPASASEKPSASAPAGGTTLKSEDEKSVVSTSKLDLPASWPKDIPVPEDAKIQIKMELPTGGHKLSYGTQKSVEDMAAYYQTEMKKLGWAAPSTTNAGKSAMLNFKDADGRMVMISASNSSGVVTSVSITHMPKK